MSILWTSAPWSWPLLLIAAVGAVFLTVRFYGQSRPHPPEGLGRALVILRATALLLLVLAVAGPIFSRIFSRDVAGQLVFLLEDSASMELADGASGVTRWTRALETAARIDSALSARGLDINIRLIRGNGIADLHEFHLQDAVIPDPQQHGTNLGVLLGKTGTRLAADPVRALVLLSDGQETSGGVETQISTAFSPQAEVLIAGVGDPAGSADRLIKDIRYPETAFQGDEITIEATVLQRFGEVEAAQPFTAYLKMGDRILAQETFEGGHGAVNMEMSFVGDVTGLQMLELEVSALGNERFLGNNRVSLGIDIHKARSRILLLASQPGWNVRFLKQAASQENRLAMEVVYPAEKGLVFADSLKKFVEPRTVDQWLEYDGVILAGWSGQASQLNHKLLGEAVDAGLGLLVLPDLQERGRGRLQTPAAGLQDLLPVVLKQVQWVRGPLFARPDSTAFVHPFYNGLNIETGENLFSDSPPLNAVVRCNARLDSQVLLLALRQETDLNSALPLLVTGSRQDGRTAFWTGSRLWEMAFWEKSGLSPDETPRHTVRRALGNLLVWLADGNQESGLNFSGRRAFYQEGENIRLGARWQDMRGQPVTAGRISLEIRKPASAGQEGEIRSFPFHGFDAARGEFEFIIPAMPPGRYFIQLVGHGESEVRSSEEELMITSYSVELTQVRQDNRRLRLLAKRVGADYFNLHEAAAEKEMINRLAAVNWENSSKESRHRWDPASGWPFLVTVVLLLACEWFLRRRHGLL